MMSEGKPSRAPFEGDVDLVAGERFFPNKEYRGLIIEVGAAKPDYLSISRSFRHLGWRAIAIKPNPKFVELHRALGHEVIECACGSNDADGVSFFVVSNDGVYLGGKVTNESYSSLGIRGKYEASMRTVPTQVTEIKVQTRRLETILSERSLCQSDVDILSVDAEGWELEVLAGLSADQPGTKVLVIENLFRESHYVDEIMKRGYAFWRRIQPNDVFVRADLVRLGS